MQDIWQWLVKNWINILLILGVICYVAAFWLGTLRREAKDRLKRQQQEEQERKDE